MTDRESIINKVRKLLAFDEDTATQGEIENAMSLAQQLMEKHALDAADVDRISDEPEEIWRDKINSELNSTLATWESMLANAVEQAVPGVNHYRGREYKRTFGNGGRSRRIMTIVWYGPADLVEVAKALFDETRLVISTLAAGVYGGVYRGQGRSYCEGFADALRRKAEAQRSGSEHAEQLNAIVLSSEAANRGWLLETHGVKLSKASRSSGGRHFGDAYGEGKKDGERHGFTPGKPTGKLRGGRLALPGS